MVGALVVLGVQRMHAAACTSTCCSWHKPCCVAVAVRLVHALLHRLYDSACEVLDELHIVVQHLWAQPDNKDNSVQV